MRAIERASAFKRDFKRTKAAPRHRQDVEALLSYVVGCLARDQQLSEQYRDHGLVGNWAGYRECHLKPDLLLIYQKPDATTLRLVRLGTHSDLFC
ncbi:MAG: type II toxin-antitoxin system mRNA interferase toxin, RelE/StbE family [Gammaproteobacteria bacterium]|jgi:mRNA interferase YafQ|nr:type II toxin-antitoxin system mRNA interferase toxin, RelE/StbE family [Gammaproteobacteria bacterium]